jgi:para-aminobenzoate synthetase component 1
MDRVWKQFDTNNSIAERLALWSSKSEFGFCFRGDGWGAKNNSKFAALAGIGVFANYSGTLKEASDFVDQANDYVVSSLSYKLKNELENLSSNNPTSIEIKPFLLTIPEVVVIEGEGQVRIGIRGEILSQKAHEDVLSDIENIKSNPSQQQASKPNLKWSRNEYLTKIRKTKDYIQLGEIYQANICQEINWSQAQIQPALLFNRGYENNPNPFSVYVRLNNKHILSWSPERFLSLNDREVLSQPMKGTAPRGIDKKEDDMLKAQLAKSEKDRRENVMIVDMVRNDLSHFAEKKSVHVPELYKIDTYPSVHQMHSTVKSILRTEVSQFSALLKAFPMASMTGAPKVRAMQVIDDIESSGRGMFSGSIGFFAPNGKADFNVVIRTLIYDDIKQLLSAHVGGGITALSDEESEYEECLVKLDPIRKLLYEIEK